MNGSRVDVGTPSNDFSGWTTTEVCFHNFANLSTETGENVSSPEFSSLGHRWKLYIYPGGNEESAEGMVAVYLYNRSNRSIKIEDGYSVKDAAGKEVVHHEPSTSEFAASGNAIGYDNFANRSKIMTIKYTPQFIPTNPITKNVLELLDDEESADVAIEVGGQQDTGDNKRTKTSTTTFHAHRIILKKCAPALYDMCVSSDGGEDVTSVPINDVTPEIFRHIALYLRGKDIRG